MATGWFFPPAILSGLPNTDARTQSVAAYGASKLAVAGYAPAASGASLFGYDTNANAWTLIQGSSNGHYQSAVSDGASGFAAITRGGLYTHFNSSGAVSGTNTLASGSGPYSAVIPTSGHGDFVVAYSGNLYAAASGALTGSFFAASGSNVVTQAINYNNAALYMGLVPAADAIGETTSAGVYSATLAGPATISKLACLASSGANVLAGGTSNATLGASGQRVVALNPSNSLLLLGVSSTLATVFLGLSATSNVWTASSQLSGITGACSAATWSANGTQALLTDSTNGKFQVLNYSAGTLTIAQTLTLSGAGAVAVATDGVSALVCRPAQNQVAVFQQSASVWSQITGNTLSVSGAVAIVPLGAMLLVGGAAGVSVLTVNAGTWSINSTIATGFPVTAMAVDTHGNAYAANGSNIAMISNSTVAGSGTFTGLAGSTEFMVVFQNQAAVADTSGNIVVLGQSGGTSWSAQNTYANSLGGAVTDLYQANKSIFQCGASTAAPLILNWAAPYTLANAKSGSLSVYASSVWHTLALGNDKVPTTVNVDQSGNYWGATDDNSLYEFSAAGALVSSSSVPNYPGMSTPLGVSSLVFAYGHTYAGCSLFGGVVQVN